MTRSDNDYSYIEDKKAWIFSLDRCVKLNIDKNAKQNAIKNNQSVLCGFGETDIVILKNPHLRKDNSTLAGRTYQYPAIITESYGQSLNTQVDVKYF